MGFTSPESNFQPTCPLYPPCSQYFQDSYSVPPVQNRKPLILEMSMCESKQKSKKSDGLTISPQISKQHFIFLSPIATKWWTNQLRKYAWAMTQAQIARNHDIDMMVQISVLTIWPFLMSLTILLEPMNHVVLKNKTPFSTTIWTCPNSKFWKWHW